MMCEYNINEYLREETVLANMQEPVLQNKNQIQAPSLNNIVDIIEVDTPVIVEKKENIQVKKDETSQKTSQNSEQPQTIDDVLKTHIQDESAKSKKEVSDLQIQKKKTKKTIEHKEQSSDIMKKLRALGFE